MAALAGSSRRYRGPSSTLKPSAQKWSRRSTGAEAWSEAAEGSSTTWLGVSSPPRVWAVPVKREVGGRGSSPPGRVAFLGHISKVYQGLSDVG